MDLEDLPQLQPNVPILGEDRTALAADMKHAYDQGHGITTVAARVGRSHSWVRQLLVEAGTEMRDPGRGNNSPRPKSSQSRPTMDTDAGGPRWRYGCLVQTHAVLTNLCDEVLLVKGPGGHNWQLPGGFALPNEELRQACRRTIRDDLGRDLELDRLLASRRAPPAKGRPEKLSVAFLVAFRVAPGDLLVPPQHACFVTPDTLDATPTTDHTGALLRDVLRSLHERPTTGQLTDVHQAEGPVGALTH